ncbi:DUF6308 family protein [Kineosporia sp. NBRC 101731]|uniref:DUF6308 family protein n=1 Tax=Kineosporia sp. NBRC 101731 TaxID=3032199 RepID=UPI0024A4C50F|nr:DUF6308 family protein [Kineosporia sp. NBRC 101731]GLY29494.1 hypothetical protein Kisp02_28590 [Kineosporia sp. NBRC 101731]
MAVTALKIGRFSISVAKAETWVRQYTAERTRPAYAYPAYDGYRASGRAGPLEDADLLAPVLLNVRPTLEAYYWLQSRLPVLNEALDRIPPDASITGNDLGLLEPLFAVLDGNTRWGVGMPTLATVLHRKRPGFVPLWDERVRACYYGADAPVPPVPGRGKGQLAVAVAAAMRDDLTAATPAWAALATIATEPAITPLRVLDIVAWQLGKDGESVPRQAGPADATV